MKVVTLLNEKGGVGKTTLATHIAAGLAVRGKRVLLVDSDAQANATTGLGLQEQPGFYDLLVRNTDWKDVLQVLAPESYEPPNEKSQGLLAIVPSNDETALIQQKVDNAYIIYDRLQQLKDNIDVVVFDTSPTPSLLHGAIYLATDSVIYPTQCEAYSIQGLVKTISKLDRFSEMRKNQTGREIKMLGIVPTMYRPNTVEHSENLNDLQSHYPNAVWSPLKLKITYGEAAMMRIPVFKLDPHCSAAQEIWQVVSQVESSLIYE